MTVASIQRRLFLLLLRAFAIVVVIVVISLLILTGIWLSTPSRINPITQTPLITSLETYYLVHGNWDGVHRLFVDHAITPLADLPPRWERSLLLDDSGRVVIDRGQTDSSLVGKVYSHQADETQFVLRVNDAPVGTLIVEPNDAPIAWRSALRLLLPVVLLSFFPAILTLVIGMLLMRRVVNPLADVIAAAQSVAAGDLSARVAVRGPDDLRALSDSFNQMANALERSDCERRNMLADIAHELRTPLTVIRGRLEGIVDGVYLPDDVHIAPILESTYLLERLVEDLRLLTLAETRQLHFEKRPVALAELAQRAADLFEAEAAEKGIVLAVQAQADLPMVTVDPQRIEQVIGNLISNALRYTPSGGRVSIGGTHTPTSVGLQVNDTGPGVPEEDLPHIFDRFWRGDKSRSRVAGGAGLGLAIARQLIEAQGGTIRASNLPDGGLQVCFIFPFP